MGGSPCIRLTMSQRGAERFSVFFARTAEKTKRWEFSLSPSCVNQGNSKVVHENDIMCWELFGFRAVRKDDCKLLRLPKPFGSNDWQLYDLAKDPGELQDLSHKRPELCSQMAQAWERYAQETGVIAPSVTPLE
jgi:hypothetical protein